ncbi:MAG: restriction endonuclease subunit S [Mycoplasmatales bacterium]
MKFDDWKEIKIEECGILKNGKVKKKDGSLYPIYGGNGILGYTNEYNSEDSIIIGRVGAYCGSIHYERRLFWTSDNAITFTAVSENQMFMYYLFQNLDLNQYKIGTTQPLLTQTIISRLKIKIPPIEVQKKIATMLSSLDDKIENNNKIIERLEELSQVLYKQWFIDFEFPNENGDPYKSSGGEMSESEYGMIPLNWYYTGLAEKKSFSKLVKSGIKKFKKLKKYVATADVNEHVLNNNLQLISNEERPSRANMQPKLNTIWFAKMKESRKLIYIKKDPFKLCENYILSTGFAGLDVEKEYLEYYWCYILSEKFNVEKNSRCFGTTMQAINNNSIKDIQILIPNIEISLIFGEKIGPIFDEMEVLKFENQQLATMRNELLPKLMNGEIEID